MFKYIVLLFTVFATVYCRPGLLHSAAIVAPAVAIPSAVSHTSRVDIHSAPIVVAKAAPILTAVAAPIHTAHWALPAAASYSTRLDLHSAPVIATLGHPW